MRNLVYRTADPRMVLLVSAVLVTVALAGAAPTAAQDPCLEPDNGSGTVTLPPEGCEYLSARCT